MSEKEKRVFFTQEWQKHEREVTYPYYRAKSEVTENDRGSYVYERVERTKITLLFMFDDEGLGKNRDQQPVTAANRVTH
jgi:hypothetical protein